MKKPFYTQVIILVLVILMGFGNVTFAQTNEPGTRTTVFQHFIGAQFNPYLNRSFFTGDIKQFPFALRYGWMAPSGISFGPEFSGNFGHSSGANWHVLKFGMFFRYTFLKQKNVSPFVEASGFYRTGKLKVTDSRYGENSGDTHVHRGFGYYVAPGISINLYKKRLLLDFMVEFSTDRFLNGEHFIPSIRLVYRF